MKIIKSLPQQNIYFKEEILEDGVFSQAEAKVINVYDDVQYQQILGFGAAFTESSAYNYAQLTPDQKKAFLESYFSRDKGLGYNIGRTHINSCDFSIDIYNYVENGDKELKTFHIDRDRKYIIPMIKDALPYCQDELALFASPWSPPAYMKDNESPINGGSLKEEYKPVWARYYAKYIKEMRKEGIFIQAITVQNEPKANQPWESCYYSPEGERDFIEKYLAPTLDEEGLSDIKIIIWDHNKERVYDRSKKIFASPAVKERVWAVGHHWYSGDHFEGLQLVHEQFGKPLICTEICGTIDTDMLTLAERYGKELIGNFNHYTAAFCDWNMLLDEKGGPYHNRNRKTPVPKDGTIVFEDKSKGCYAPILFDSNTKELVYTPIYYYIGHFSKYVHRGARRIATTKYTDQLNVTGFQNPDGSLVLVLLNATDNALPARIRRDDLYSEITLDAHSIITILF